MFRGEMTQPQVSVAVSLAFDALRRAQVSLTRNELPDEEQLERMRRATMTGQDSPEVRAFLRRWMDDQARALLTARAGEDLVAAIYGD
jgi:hypothetical protein